MPNFKCVYCTVVELTDVDNIVSVKYGLEVIAGHWTRHHATDRIRVPISVP